MSKTFGTLAGCAGSGDIKCVNTAAASRASGANPAVPTIIATPLEVATVLKLRDRAGWWCGDPQAIKILRQFAADSICEYKKAVEEQTKEKQQ